jgi:hypothetical protein
VLSNTQILLLAGSDSFQRGQIRPGETRAQCMTGRFPFPTGCRVSFAVETLTAHWTVRMAPAVAVRYAIIMYRIVHFVLWSDKLR